MHSPSTDSVPEAHTVEEQLGNGEPARVYQKLRFLGKGAFARVFEFLRLDTNTMFAAKVVPKQVLRQSRVRQKLLNEIKIHRSLTHENVVKFEHVFEDQSNVYILLELCPHQTLNEMLKRRKCVSELEARTLLFQVICGLRHVHNLHIVHRDIKPANLFLGEAMQVKIGDFGLASRIEYTGEKKRTKCGTPNYIAPEILEGHEGHSYQVDVWSLGVVAYMMVVGKPPFEAKNLSGTYSLIKSSTYSFPPDIEVSPQFKDLIHNIFNLLPDQRPTLDQVLHHPFFTETPFPKALPASTLAVPLSTTYLKKLHETERTSPERSLEPADYSQIKKEETHTSKRVTTNATLGGQVGAVHLVRWVDYSSKYGFVYLLSNNCVGLLFNDSTIILAAGDRFCYVPKGRTVFEYSFLEYPSEYAKKVGLLEHFRKHLMKKTEEIEGEVVFVQRWVHTPSATILQLNNKDVQVKFTDGSELFLETNRRTVTFLNKKKEVSVHAAATETARGVAKRLRYIKQALESQASHRTRHRG